MEHYDLEVCGLKRELPFVKLSDGTAYASFVVISDTELIEKAGKELAAFANGAEIILTIEAKGIALAYEISKQLHMKEFVVVRKSVKSYVKSFIQDAVHSITTEGNQDIFLDETDAEKLKGKKVAIVDDHKLVSKALENMISLNPNFQVTMNCFNAQDFIDELQKTKSHPDVVLMDINMPKVDGIEGLKQIKTHFPQIKVLIQTAYDDSDRI